MKRAVYKIPTIRCEGCAQSIQRSLGRLQGVETVSVDVAMKRVAVVYDPIATDETAIRERLTAAGFPAESFAA